MRIIQIAPRIGAGSGVAGVAHNLEQEWQRLGHQTMRFTLDDAWGGWLREPGPGIRGKLALLLQVVWFSTVGTLLARRLLRQHPDAVSVCHNDALAGDVYVNHGIVQAAMRSRGSYAWRMLRNPLHAFTAVRDRHRYRSKTIHRLVVNLVSAEEGLLRQVHPRLAIPTIVIGNGVDESAFVPPTASQRTRARDLLGLDDGHLAVVFVGHEFDRKGLPLLLEALVDLPPAVHLVVVGGTSDLVDGAAGVARRLGVVDRLHFAGQVADPRPYFHAGDVFALPSAYESYGLVVLEALASGLPVIATATGCVPDVIISGVNGYVVARDPAAVRRALLDMAGDEQRDMSAAARSTAETHTWRSVAASYLDAFEDRLVAAPTSPRSADA